MENTIGGRIKAERKANKISQEKLAEKAELSKNYIYLIESGRETPGKNAVRDIANILNVRQEWLLTGDEPKRAPPEDEVAAYVEDLMGEDNNPLYELIKSIMKTYNALDSAGQQVIKDFAKNLIEKNESRD